MDIMVETRDLAKTFGNAQHGEVQAVKGIDLRFRTGRSSACWALTAPEKQPRSR